MTKEEIYERLDNLSREREMLQYQIYDINDEIINLESELRTSYD
jgi:hypothetical protein